MVKVIQLEEVDSTNSYGKKHIDEFGDKTAIITKKQTSGRGRLNRSWVDLGEENLFFQLFLNHPKHLMRNTQTSHNTYLSHCAKLLNHMAFKLKLNGLMMY